MEIAAKAFIIKVSGIGGINLFRAADGGGVAEVICDTIPFLIILVRRQSNASTSHLSEARPETEPPDRPLDHGHRCREGQRDSRVCVAEAVSAVGHEGSATVRGRSPIRGICSGEFERARAETRLSGTQTASFHRRKHGVDETTKAGIGATVCSVFILAIVFLAMHTLPFSIG